MCLHKFILAVTDVWGHFSQIFKFWHQAETFLVLGHNRGHQRVPIYTLVTYILTQTQAFLSIKYSLITFPHLSDVSIKHALIIWPDLFTRWSYSLYCCDCHLPYSKLQLHHRNQDATDAPGARVMKNVVRNSQGGRLWNVVIVVFISPWLIKGVFSPLNTSFCARLGLESSSCSYTTLYL